MWGTWQTWQESHSRPRLLPLTLTNIPVITCQRPAFQPAFINGVLENKKRNGHLMGSHGASQAIYAGDALPATFHAKWRLEAGWWRKVAEHMGVPAGSNWPKG